MSPHHNPNNMCAAASPSTEWPAVTNYRRAWFASFDLLNLEAKINALYEKFPYQTTIKATKSDYEKDRNAAITEGLAITAASWYRIPYKGSSSTSLPNEGSCFPCFVSTEVSSRLTECSGTTYTAWCCLCQPCYCSTPISIATTLSIFGRCISTDSTTGSKPLANTESPLNRRVPSSRCT